MQTWSQYNAKQKSNELKGRVLAINDTLGPFSFGRKVIHVTKILFWDLIAVEETVTSLLFDP